MNTLISYLSYLTNFARKQSEHIFTSRLSHLFFASVLLLSVMSPVSAAPSPLLRTANPPNHKPVHSTAFINPCAVYKSSREVRHGPQITLTTIQNELKQALNHFKHINETLISGVYESTLNLPHNRCKVKVLAEQKTVHHVVTKLNSELLVFANTFQKLSDMVLGTESASVNKIKPVRKEILKEINNHLKNFRCEMEIIINGTQAVAPVGPDCGLEVFGHSWPKNPNLSLVLPADMITFVRYKTFLEEWLQLTQEVFAATRTRKPGRTRIMKRGSKKQIKKPNKNKKRIVTATKPKPKPKPKSKPKPKPKPKHNQKSRRVKA